MAFQNSQLEILYFRSSFQDSSKMLPDLLKMMIIPVDVSFYRKFKYRFKLLYKTKKNVEFTIRNLVLENLREGHEGDDCSIVYTRRWYVFINAR